MTNEARPVVLLLADISGYTRFMVAHEKSLRHSQTIIRALLESLMAQVGPPLQVSEVQGDALFMYALKGPEGQDWSRQGQRLTTSVLRLFDVFAKRLAQIGAYSICRCDACSNMGDLQLKVIVHSGEALLNKVGDFGVLSGVDVIRLHRLAKNSVEAGEYVLLTESAFQDLGLPEGVAVDERVEEYDVGSMMTYVYLPDTDRVFDPKDLNTSLDESNVGISILREEIKREYTEVAQDPARGYHFNTGRKAAGVLDYQDSWIEGIPEAVLDSFAGTGNPFNTGEIVPGDHVVDVGSGAGVDSLIAATMVGRSGQVIGVDMTDAMLRKARSAAVDMELTQVEFRQGYIEQLPIPDNWADVVISNGVVNLSPDKSLVLREMSRVLRPGGTMLVADILVEKEVPEEARGNLDLWTN